MHEMGTLIKEVPGSWLLPPQSTLCPHMVRELSLNPAGALTADVQPSELWRTRVWCSLPSLWHFVTAAWTNWDILCSMFIVRLSAGSVGNISMTLCDSVFVVSLGNVIFSFFQSARIIKLASGKHYQDKYMFTWENVCIRNCVCEKEASLRTDFTTDGHFLCVLKSPTNFENLSCSRVETPPTDP